MKTKGFEGFIRLPSDLKAAAALALFALAGCKNYVIKPDGTKVPESVYAHELSVGAYKENVKRTDECDRTAATSLSDLGRVASLQACTIRALGGSGQAQVPTYQAPPTVLDRVFQSAPIILGVGQLVGADRANQRQNDASVLIAGINANRELGIVQAATGSNAAIAGTGYNALGGVATAGFNALGESSAAASAANAQNSTSWAAAMAALPATTQIIAGGNITQAGRDSDQSTTGGDRVEGDGNRLRNTVECNAQGGNGAPATAGNNSGTTGSGTSSPLTAAYNPLVSGGDGASAANNCGGG